MAGTVEPAAPPVAAKGSEEPAAVAPPRAPAPRDEPPGCVLVARRCVEPPLEDLVEPAVESAPPPRRPGWEACEPEPADAPLAPEVEPPEPPEPVAAEPPPRGSEPPEPVVPPLDPPPPEDGSGTEGTLTAGVETGPTFTEGTVTSGVDEGVGTLVPPGRSSAAGTAVVVGAAASTLISAASVTTAASVALRKTPAIFIPEYPRTEL